MTVRGKSAGGSIQRTVDKDILCKLLWQKPTGKSRREVVHSAGSSFPSHISRKLLLEEHKLNTRLEQIEKERKHFLSKNSNEKHMLKLSAWTAKALQNRRNRGQHLAMSEHKQYHSSVSDHCHYCLNEGNELFGKTWNSTTTGVFYPSGAESLRQLQIKKVCLLKKMAERHHVTTLLPWKRSYDIPPQVPPPSRSPSKTNIIWVRVHNTSGDMEIDGFLRTSDDFDELLPGNKNDIEEQDRVHKNTDKNTSITKIQDSMLSIEKDTLLETFYEDKFSVDSLDAGINQCLKQSSLEHTTRPTVISSTQTGLKVSSQEIRRGSNVRRRLEEEAKNGIHKHEKYSTSHLTGDDNSHVLNTREKTASSSIEGDSNWQRDRNDFVSDRQDTVNDRKSIVSNSLHIVSGRSKSKCGRRKIAREHTDEGNSRQGSGGERRNVGKHRERIKSGKHRSNPRNPRKSAGNDRKDEEKQQQDIGSGRNTPDAGENANKENITKRRIRKSRGTRINSPTKITLSKTVQKFVQMKSSVQGIGIFATKFATTSKSTGNDEKKISSGKTESKKSLPKPRSVTRLNDKKSSIKLPKKSCSACIVKLSAKDGGLRGTTRSKSDTAAFCKVRKAVVLQDPRDESRTASPGRKSQPPVPIMLPSQSQLQNFDKVARIKLSKTLTMKMRRHCYTGNWAFPPPGIRHDAKDRDA